MAALVDEAMASGALGFSTSRTLLHVVPDGRQVPGTFADGAELLAFGEVLGRHGKGIFEAAARLGERDREEGLPKTRAEMAMLGEISRRNGRPVSFGLVSSLRRPELYSAVVEMAHEQNDAGAMIRPQTTCRGIGVIYHLLNRLPFRNEAWRQVMGLPPEQRLAPTEQCAPRIEDPPQIAQQRRHDRQTNPPDDPDHRRGEIPDGTLDAEETSR